MLKKLTLSVTQKIALSLFAAAIILIACVAENTYSLNKITKSFSSISDEALPLGEASNELLNDSIQLLTRIKVIDNAQTIDDLNQIRADIDQRVNEFNEHIIKSMSSYSTFPEVLEALAVIEGQAKAFDVDAKAIAAYHEAFLIGKQSLPDKMQSMQMAVRDIRNSLRDISDVEEVSIGGEEYAMLEALDAIEVILNGIYAKPDASTIQKYKNNFIKYYEQFNHVRVELENLDEFESEEWYLFLDAADVLTLHATDGEGLFNSLARNANNQSELKQAQNDFDTLYDELRKRLEELNSESNNILQSAERNFIDVLSFSQNASLIIGTIMVLAFTLIGYSLHLSIKNPLGKIRDYVGHIERGDLQQHIELNTKDEFQNTAQLLDRVSDRLSEIILKIRDQVSGVEQSSDFIANSSASLTQGLEAQDKEIHEAFDLISELEQSSDRMGTSMHSAQGGVNEVLNETHAAVLISEESLQKVADLKDRLNGTNDSVELLVSLIQEIGNLSSLIADIAEQTNLLALNAAIEAARAGEQGRGFAVVADEVRSLAARTHDSTESIEKQIKKLIHHSEDSRASVNQCYEIAESASQAFKDSGEAMHKIVRSTEKIADIVKTVDAAAKQQTSATHNVVEKLDRIGKVSENNAATFGLTRDIMTSLRDMSGQLMQEVKFFKVKDESTPDKDI